MDQVAASVELAFHLYELDAGRVEADLQALGFTEPAAGMLHIRLDPMHTRGPSPNFARP